MLRRRSCFWGLVVACGLFSLVVGVVAAGTHLPAAGAGAEICGTIDEDAAWIRSASPYIVTCDTTLEAGVRLDIEPGVEIRFEPDAGFLVEGTLAASGTPSLPVTFTSNSLVPARGDWSGLMFVAGSSASELRGCTVEYATTGVWIYAVGGSTVSPVVADCTVRENAARGIRVEGQSGLCQGATASPSIERCTIERNTGPGVEYYGHGSADYCDSPAYGVAGGTLSDSTIRGNSDGVHLNAKAGAISKGWVNPVLDADRIAANSENGIRVEGDDPVGVLVQNSLIYDNGAGGIDWRVVDQASNPHFVNNTIVANGGDGIVCGDGYAGSILIENNILAANGGYGLSDTCLSFAAISSNDVWDNALDVSGARLAAGDNLAADPQFVDAPAGDFHLQLGSPCIDAGTATGAPATDAEGTLRPQGSAVDIGAYEFWSPEIGVWQGSREIGDGTEFAFGRVRVGARRVVTFTVGNLGNRALSVERIDLAPAGPFSVVVPGGLPLIVGAGLSGTFDLEFAPRATGPQTATVAIASDDPDENPLRFTVSGTGVQPVARLSIAGPETGLIDRAYEFTATVEPLTATLPVTYVWRAAGQFPLTSTAGLSDATSLAWDIAGPRLISVTAENVEGRVTATHVITLYTPVESDFVAHPVGGRAPLAVAFTNASRGDYTASRWDFGDGAASGLDSPVHIYTVPGTFTVTLQVQGPGGSDESIKAEYIVVEAYGIHLPLLLRNG